MLRARPVVCHKSSNDGNNKNITNDNNNNEGNNDDKNMNFRRKVCTLPFVVVAGDKRASTTPAWSLQLEPPAPTLLAHTPHLDGRV